MKTRLIAPLMLGVVLAGSLTACGGDDGDSASDAPTSAAASGAPEAGEGRGPGGDSEQFAAIQTCLEAAGLADALPSGGPEDGGAPPSGMPNDFPTDGTPPTGMPSGGPSGAPDGAGGPGGGFQDDPEVQAALEACGISVPTGPPAAQESQDG